MSIQAGPNGSFTSRNPPGTPVAARWQTPLGRSRAEAAPITLSIARETVPGVPAPGPYHQVLNSKTSICWLPTFEPFRKELPPGCNWVVFGAPGEIPPEFRRLYNRWKRVNGQNTALERLVPEQFVRDLLVDHVSNDLAVGMSGGWAISVDRHHGGVMSARFASDSTIQTSGFALPILVPRVGHLDWTDVSNIRRLPAIERLREVLHEVEAESLEVVASGSDLESAVRRAYDKKFRSAIERVEGLGALVTHGLAELLVGTALGYATIGLVLLGPPVGAAIGGTIMTGWQVHKIRRYRRERAWVSVMDAISSASPVTAPRLQLL